MRPYPLPTTSQIGVEAIGIIVKNARVGCGLSQRQLGMLCGMNQSTISRLETGRLRHLRFQRLATVLGVLYDPLLGRAPRLNRWSS
jgi:transcriptional regulator with XRE-family HTH domain